MSTTTKILWGVLAFVVLSLGLIGAKLFMGSKSASTPVTSLTGLTTPDFVASPSATEADRVKNLEYAVGNLVTQIKSGVKPTTTSDLENRVKALETSLLNLQSRVKTLESKTTTTTTTTSTKSDGFIPLNWSGTTTSTDWTSVSSQVISLDPASYSGYSSMKFEVSLKLDNTGGRGYARLFNQDDNSAVTLSEASSDQSTSTWVSSGGFTLPVNRKSYYLQIKSTANYVTSVQNAQIRVSY